jgi:hypothetical protein
MIDLNSDVPKQLAQLFLKALKIRVEEEHRPEQFPDYSERLYESGFRDVVQRRSEQLANRLAELEPEDIAPAVVNQQIDELFEGLLDFFIIDQCRDINEVRLPQAILKYQQSSLEEITLFQLVMDYLDFESEPTETVYTDFLKMPANALKNASRFFLFPSKDEHILFICDQSLLGACKEGFAMTEYGLYWKAQLQTAKAVQYPALHSIKREKEWILINGHFFNASLPINIRLMKLMKKLYRLHQ